jgi:hypothetical protein
MAVITRLEINAANGTEGFKSYAIGVNIPVNINYALADVREPDKRKASFSKTINLPGSSQVNILFENIFSVNVQTQYFNKNLKTPVRYIVDEVENFKGDLQLLKVNIEPSGAVMYECSIIGEGGSVFVDIGEKLITGNSDSADDLDFSAYNHTYNRSTQISTRANAGTGLNVCYPFVDVGTNGSSDTVWNVTDFLPCFHVYEYIKKIIEKTGRTFTSAFMESAEFKTFGVYPNMNAVALTTAELQNKQWYVGLSADATVPVSPANVDWTNSATGGFYDLGNQLDVSDEFIDVNANGYYNVASQQFLRITISHTDPTVARISGDVSIATKIRKSVGAGTPFNITNVNAVVYSAVTFANAKVNGTPFLASASSATGEQYLSAGDRIYVQVSGSFGAGTVKYWNAAGTQITPVGTFTCLIELVSGTGKTSFYGLCTQKNIVATDTMLCNSALPTKIKQKDFLKSIVQAFNLFVDVDPDDKNNLIIEPFEDFYNGEILNFEQGVDLNKERTINPNILDGKRYIFSYKEDKDYWNTLYKDTYNEVYGSEQIDVDNDFIQADKKNEIIFSPTPSVANYGLGIAHPRIVKSDDSGLTNKPFVPNIRLLIFGGVKQTENPYTYKEHGQSDITTYDYLYAGHMDDNMNPTVDLNFGFVKHVYYTFEGSQLTNNNLVNRYHLPYLSNLIDRDGKFATRYIWWTPKLINKFSFRNRLFLDNAYWIVNKIENYNPNELTSTKTELIKLLYVNPFTPSTFRIADSPTINSGGKHTVSTSSLSVGNNINLGLNCIAIGENIFIPASAENVTVIGNNVTVAENVTNSSVINTNDYELTESGYSITNNVIATDLFRTGTATTNNATPTKLLFDTPTGEFEVQQDHTYRIEVRVLATNLNGTRDSKEWVAQGVAQGNAPAIYNIVEAVTSNFSDASMAACVFAISAPGSDYIDFTVTGIAATDISWKCQVELVKIQA